MECPSTLEKLIWCCARRQGRNLTFRVQRPRKHGRLPVTQHGKLKRRHRNQKHSPGHNSKSNGCKHSRRSSEPTNWDLERVLNSKRRRLIICGRCQWYTRATTRNEKPPNGPASVGCSVGLAYRMFSPNILMEVTSVSAYFL